MSMIVAGRFERSLDADTALDALRRDGFAETEVDSFAVNPPGQHGLTPVGGDAHEDAGTRGAGTTAAIGAGLGLLIGSVIGAIVSLYMGAPALFILGGVGAFVGAFAGVMRKVHDPKPSEHSHEHPVEMPAGRMIAVCVDRAGSEARAIDALRRNGARGIGRTQGQWRDGAWRDFDPRSPLAAL